MKLFVQQLAFVAATFAIALVASGQEPYVVITDSGQLFDGYGNIEWSFVLLDEDVNGLLETTEEQKHALLSMVASAQSERNAALLKNIGDKSVAQDQILQFDSKIRGGLDSILLDHQVDSLGQIIIERALAENKGIALLNALANTENQLISNDDLQSLKTKLTKAQRELESKVQKLRLDAWNELVHSLSKAHQKSVQKRFKIKQ